MKSNSIKTGLAVILSAILCVSSHSCSSEIESTVSGNNLNVEEDIITLSSEYSSLYEDLFKTILRDYKQISSSDVDEYFKNFAELYESQLTPEESKLLNRSSHIYSTRGTGEHITIPNEFIDKIKPIMFDENIDLLTEEISEFYSSQYFLSLNYEEQRELRIQLESLKKIRNSVVGIVIEHFQNEDMKTRMSPGDRMVWSGTVSQLNDEQQSKLIDAGLAGIALVTSGVSAAVVTVVGFVKSLFG